MPSQYDLEFTAEISAKMQVPDRICVVEGLQNSAQILQSREEIRSMMNVPERIFVADLADCQSIPEIKYEKALTTSGQNYIVEAPPSVLTVDEYPHPSVGNSSSLLKDVKKSRSSTTDLQTSGIDSKKSAYSEHKRESELSAIVWKMIEFERALSTISHHQQLWEFSELLVAAALTCAVLKGIAWHLEL